MFPGSTAMAHSPRSHCVEEGGSSVAEELVLLFRSSESSHLCPTRNTTRVLHVICTGKRQHSDPPGRSPALPPLLFWALLFHFIDYAKAFDCVDHNKLQKILNEMGIPDHLTCLLTNLYAGQQATVRTGHGTTDWFQIGKGVRQGCILSPWLFNF